MHAPVLPRSADIIVPGCCSMGVNCVPEDVGALSLRSPGLTSVRNEVRSKAHPRRNAHSSRQGEGRTTDSKWSPWMTSAWYVVDSRREAGWVRLTTCASAAGSQARARTSLRSLERPTRVPPTRSPAPVRPVGCMRGLGSCEGVNSTENQRDLRQSTQGRARYRRLR
jgi:hypothetical protein